MKLLSHSQLDQKKETIIKMCVIGLKAELKSQISNLFPLSVFRAALSSESWGHSVEKPPANW